MHISHFPSMLRYSLLSFIETILHGSVIGNWTLPGLSSLQVSQQEFSKPTVNTDEVRSHTKHVVGGAIKIGRWNLCKNVPLFLVQFTLNCHIDKF